MKRTVPMSLSVVALLSVVTGSALAQKPAIIETRVIWGSAPTTSFSDLIRFKDHWYCSFEEAETGDVCVVRSSDGKKWQAVAQIRLPSPRRGDHDPQLSITPKEELMVAAAQSFPKTTRQTMLRFSKDGRKWGKPIVLPDRNFIHTNFQRHKGVTYSYGYGCICGIAQTVQIFANKSGRAFAYRYEETFSGFFPGSAALVFDGDKGYALMGRWNRPGYLGWAKVPFGDWRWKNMKSEFTSPNAIRLPDGRIVVAAGFRKPNRRTSLCWFDPKSGKLSEFLKLPTGGGTRRAGLAFHDGHLWVSYQANAKGRYAVHLSRVKVGKP